MTPNPAHGRVLRDSYGHVHELFGPFDDIAGVRRANERKGHQWFEQGSLRFFGSEVESEVMYGRLFLSSEQQPTHSGDEPIHPRRFTIRVACDDGAVHSVGEFQGFGDRDDALDELHRLAVGPRCEFANHGDSCRLAVGHDGDHHPGAEVYERSLP